MKKVYALITALVLLSCSVVSVVAATINSERDQVVITENVLYGDRSYAEGLDIKTKNHLNYRLYWETDFAISNDSKANTKFNLYPRQKHENNSANRRHEGIFLDNGIEYGFYDDLPASEQKGIQKAYKELFDSAELGVEKSKKVYLKDYYDYYPVGVGFDLPYTHWTGYEYGDVLKGEPYDALYVTEKFREYLKIPVLDSDTVTISVEKGEDGHSYSTGTDEMGCFNLSAIGTVARKWGRCFFTIHNYKYSDAKNNTDEIEYVDTSLIPGGYGIYSFYYAGGDSASRTGIIADKIETVFPLDSKTIVSHITMSKDDKQLLLFTVEDKSFYLTVIDIKTMKAAQKILIKEEQGSGSVYEYDDFIVADTENDITVISEKDGVYTVDFSVRKASFINEKFHDIGVADCMDYKDDKLAIVGNCFEEDTGYELCDFFVSVYDKSGILYYGKYNTSLDLGRTNDTFISDCHPTDINPNLIKWK